jgi:ATPase family AAA domain-containing protein 2
MPYNGPKRKLEDFDPNASDPNDSDFEDAGPSRPSGSSRRRSHKKASRGSSGAKLHSKKRQRRRYGSDDSDIVVDDDDEISEEPFTESEEEEEEIEVNPRTGRAVRSAVKNNDVKYEESDADEELFIEETADEADELTISPKKTRRSRPEQPRKLIVRLQFDKWTSLTNYTVPQTRRSRTRSKPPTTTMAVGTRKSSRLSQDAEPTMELSNSGRHAEIRRPGTTSPEQIEIGGRRTRGGKGPRAVSAGKQPRKMPSDIIEESQGHTERASEEPEAVESEDDDEAVVPDEVVESVEFHEPDEDEIVDDEEVVDVAVEEPDEGKTSRSQSSEGPVRRSARNLRVSG